MKTHKVYTGKDLVDRYDYRHFGGKGGQHVFHRDCAVLESLLGASRGLLLDVPCGTGVYSIVFQEKGHRVVAADASMLMLEKTGQRRAGIPRVLCDINQLPFKSGVLDAVMTVRLFQHLPGDNVVRVLQELGRVTGPGGLVIFDTFRWSPRKPPLFKSEMYVYSHRSVEKMIEEAGLRKVQAHSLYLFSPIMYRKMPVWFLRGLGILEKAMPQRWLLRTFWACTGN